MLEEVIREGRNWGLEIPTVQNDQPGDPNLPIQSRIPNPSETPGGDVWAGRFGTLGTMAASFFVALCLGSLAHQPGRRHPAVRWARPSGPEAHTAVESKPAPTLGAGSPSRARERTEARGTSPAMGTAALTAMALQHAASHSG